MTKKYDRFIEGNNAEESGSYKKAYHIFKELANGGDTRAMHKLALIYQSGQFVPKQLKKAIYWDLEAIKQGHTKVLINLATSYKQWGDIGRYKYYLEKAMTLGDDSAAFELAKLYSISSKERLQVKALLLLVVTRKNATDAQIKEAQEILITLENEEKLAKLAILFKPTKQLIKTSQHHTAIKKYSKKIRQQLAKAAEYLDRYKYKKARHLLQILAGGGCAKAMDYLGTIYLYGMGVLACTEQAIKWYNKAVETGCFESNLNLAIAYRHTPHIHYYKHYLEHALTKGDDNAALLLAKLYYVSDHETERVETLLEQVIMSDRVDVDAVYQAEIMLNNLINPYDYINKQVLA